MNDDAQRERGERESALLQLEEVTERPMQFLGLFWLVLLVLDLTRGLSRTLSAVSAVIWVIFIVDFLVRLFLAPHKKAYLKRNWLVAISLAVPALRIFRFIRAFRALGAIRSLSLVRIIGSVNRGMNSIRRGMKRRGFGYVVLITIIVIVAGAAGMVGFEHNESAHTPFTSYAYALWWTGMVITTLGPSIWPTSPEGRALCFLLAVYSFAVWGYITASLATFFVGQDAEHDEGEVADKKSIALLRSDIMNLGSQLREIREGLASGSARPFVNPNAQQ